MSTMINQRCLTALLPRCGVFRAGHSIERAVPGATSILPRRKLRTDFSAKRSFHAYPSRLTPSTLSPCSIVERLSLQGKVTVITGGSRGIGLTLVETVAGLGSDVVILDQIEPVRSMAELKSQYGTRFEYHRMDVTSKDEIDLTFSNIVQNFGRIDNCITSAGIALDKPFVDHTWEESRRILDINVLGSFFSAQSAAKQMMNQESGGSIVMVASIAAHCAIPAQRVSIYGASKAAIKLLGQTLAVELAPSNIRVNTISPGFIETDMSKQFTDIQHVFQTVPPLRRIGQRDDLALAVAYLLSEGASYTTGTDIAITGGLHNGRIEV